MQRSQAATEYLMTYGWAFLIIAIVAAILISLGVFSSPSSATVNIFSYGAIQFNVLAECTQVGILYSVQNPSQNVAYLANLTIYSNNIPIFSQNVDYYIAPSSSASFLLKEKCSPNTQYKIDQIYYSNGVPYSLIFSFQSGVANLATKRIMITISNPYSTPIPNSSASYYQQPIVINNSLISSFTTNMQNYYFTYPNGSLVYSFYEGDYIAPQTRPTGIAFSPNGSLIYVANEGNNQIAVISVSNHKILREISAPGSPFSVVTNGKYLYYSAFSNNSFDVINLSNGALISSQSIGTMPTVETLYNNEIFVASDSANAIYAFNASYPFNLIKTYGPYRPWSETTVNGTSKLYSSEFINVCISSEFNITTGAGIASLGCWGYASKSVASYNNLVFVTVPTLSYVSVINSTNNQIIKNISVRGVPNYVVADPKYGKLFVSAYPNYIDIINYSDLELWKTIQIGLAPSMLAVSPNGGLVVVSDKSSNYITFINASTGSIITNMYTANITNNQQVFWLKLPSIPPGKNLTIYLNFVSPNIVTLNGVQVGAAPQLFSFGNYSNIQYIMNKGLIYNWYIDFKEQVIYTSQQALDGAPLFNGSSFTQPGINYYEEAYSNPFIAPFKGSSKPIYGFLGGKEENNTEFAFQYYVANGEYTFCNATEPYPCPPFHAEGSQAANFSWSLKAIGFVYAPQNTLAFSDTDDCVGAGYLPASSSTNLNGVDWLGNINPDNILGSWGGNSGGEYVGVIPFGVYPFEFDYCEGGGSALTTFWTQTPVYYYYPDLLSESPKVTIST
ncbi:MAG: YncE family protein [Candidatus Parvarchaeota archaeon]|nr:YncE family protein [Candidatus Rehaiarchaeum fermentans]